jgi:hypothetical protein
MAISKSTLQFWGNCGPETHEIIGMGGITSLIVLETAWNGIQTTTGKQEVL